ncbi:MAG: T9SS type A sorting domain-containing protein [Ignavibacteria bacterium]
MKTITQFILAVIMTVLTVNISLANDISYKLDLTNIKYTSDRTVEFDIQLINTNGNNESISYSAGQYFLEINPEIISQGKLTFTLISSDLPEEFRPRNASVFENQLRLACNSISQNKNALPKITKDNRGILIVRMKLESTSDKFSSTPLNLKWAGNESLFRTKIYSFDGKKNFDITNADFNLVEGTSNNSDNLGNENLTSLPTEYTLSQNFPNPFNPVTKINYELPSSGLVTLKIFDLLGKEVATLVNEKMEAGRYSAAFNGSNLASGMYFYKITAGEYSAVKKMVLIK